MLDLFEQKVREQIQRRRQIRDSKYDEIIYILEIFDKELSLQDILDEPICFVNYLVDAKMRLKDAQDKAATSKVKSATTDISEISRNVKKIMKRKKNQKSSNNVKGNAKK